jgi:DinB family
MDEKALFLKFWEKEIPATRKVIERIPEDASYRPDPKSRTAREIAWLIVHEGVTLADGLEKGVLRWIDVPAPDNMKAIVERFDREYASIGRRLKALDAATFEAKVPFMFGDQQVMNESGYENAWGFLFDIIHHRGQITTYLRAMGSTVPQVYGPSADEPMM